MENRDRKAILQGLREITEYEKGKRALLTRQIKISIPIIDTVKLRERIHLTQEDFSAVFGIPLATLKNWEQNRRRPRGVAVNLLLNLIANDPEGIAKEIARFRKEE